jgi:hypothetical protein
MGRFVMTWFTSPQVVHTLKMVDGGCCYPYRSTVCIFGLYRVRQDNFLFYMNIPI